MWIGGIVVKLNMYYLVCYAIGYVFITSGAMKLLVSDFKATFINLGLPFPSTMLFLIAIIEIACGSLIIARMYVKQAIIPLVCIMAGAIYLTKIPVLLQSGLLYFAFEARLDIIVIIMLLIIWKHGQKVETS